MFENIFIGIFTAIVFVGAIAAWWLENGPEKKDKDSDEKEKDKK